MKISIPTFAAILLIVFFATLYMANADPFLSSSVQPREKQEHNQSDEQQPLAAYVLNGSNHQFDNHSPSVISGFP